jgi:hypothetical protein
MVSTLKGLVAGLATRLMIMALFFGSALILVTWIAWEETYPRQMSTVVFWAPLLLSVWGLGTIALLAGGRSRLALIYAVSVPLTGVLLGVAFLQLASTGTLGLAGVIILVAGFDITMFLVLHQLLG